jgi:hypothetical protein
MATKKLTSQNAIEDALDLADIGTRVRVKFKDITDVEWLCDDTGTDIIADMAGNALKPAVLAAIVAGVAREYTVSAKDVATQLTHEASDENLWVTHSVIKSLAVLPSPKAIAIDGCPAIIVLNPDATMRFATWTITQKGCEQLFRALASHLGYELEE